MKTTKRAAKGGEFGANGEFYEGGKFINTVAANRKREGSHKSSPLRKCEIAPYVWEMQPEGKNSLYRKFAGIFGRVEDGVAVLRCNDQILAYCGVTVEYAQSLIDLWNTGVRWV
jgi:hypothetical protein